MAVGTVFADLCGSASAYYNGQVQSICLALSQLKDLRNNPDVYQKMGQIAYASFQLLQNNYPSASSLSSLSKITSAVWMHDFYRVVQYPRFWFFPLEANAINEDVLFEDLANYTWKACKDSVTEEEIHDNDLSYCDVRNLVRDCIVQHLSSMAANEDAYRNMEELIDQLQKNLRKIDMSEFELEGNREFNLTQLDLSDLKNPKIHSKWNRNIPTVEKLMHLNWATVDVMAFVWGLREWKLLDVSKFAETVGQNPAFQWVKKHSLDQWLIGLVCTGFAWKLLESVRKLRDENLTIEETKQRMWNVATSTADLAYFGAIFANLTGCANMSNTYVYSLAIAAKSIGVLSIIYRPTHQYFQQPVGG